MCCRTSPRERPVRSVGVDKHPLDRITFEPRALRRRAERDLSLNIILRAVRNACCGLYHRALTAWVARLPGQEEAPK